MSLERTILTTTKRLESMVALISGTFDILIQKVRQHWNESENISYGKMMMVKTKIYLETLGA